MLLKVKSLKLLTGRPVAVLHENTAKILSVAQGDRIRIRNKHSIVAVVNIATGMLKENEVSLSAEIMKRIKVREHYAIDVCSEPPPRSTYYIYEKLNGKQLSKEQLHEIVGDIVHNKLTEAELAYFVSGVYVHKLSEREIADMIKSMVFFGKQLKLKGKVYDKHSIGGIAGNRTTPIVVSICAAAGLTLPKTSSRAITSAAGTADVIETLANVEFSIGQIKKIVKKTNACLVWGGSLGLAPADDKIIQVERLLSLDPESQLIASILAKKLAVKSKGVLIDISYGKSAKKHNLEEALNLRTKFQNVAKLLNLNLKVTLTDGSQPVGNGIGPVLEARDVIAVLSRAPNNPEDLEKKSVALAGVIIEMANKAKPGQGKKLAQKILDSGKAYEKFEEIITAQKGKIDLEKLQPAKFSFDIKAKKLSIIKEIDNKKIAAVARAAGCPTDKAAGLYLHAHVKQKVSKDKPIATLYAETQAKLNSAKKTFEEIKPIVMQ